MIRINGFIDVNKMLKDENINVDNIQELREYKNIDFLEFRTGHYVFNFNSDGKNYYFKYNYTSINAYNELLASLLLDDFGIRHASYDLAICCGNKGVISENYKKDGINYIKMEDLLSSSYQISEDDDIDVDIYNNLEGIWNGLEYRYSGFNNKDEIIKKLMDELVDVFIFDIITSQYDRHSRNLEIMEDNGNISLAPLYDNEGILKAYKIVSLTVDEETFSNLYKALNNFIRISSFDMKDKIISKLWIISSDNLEKKFKTIEDMTGYPMDDSFKRYYLKEFKNHYDKLLKILMDKENIRKR